MRDFFIGLLEKLVGILAVLAVLGVVLAAGVAAFGDPTVVGGSANGPSGPAVGLGILVAGLLYVIFVFGFLYLGLGIYHNTKATAEAMLRQ